jgi:hypothetical protein
MRGLHYGYVLRGGEQELFTLSACWLPCSVQGGRQRRVSTLSCAATCFTSQRGPVLGLQPRNFVEVSIVGHNGIATNDRSGSNGQVKVAHLFARA